MWFNKALFAVGTFMWITNINDKGLKHEEDFHPIPLMTMLLAFTTVSLWHDHFWDNKLTYFQYLQTRWALNKWNDRFYKAVVF